MQHLILLSPLAIRYIDFAALKNHAKVTLVMDTLETALLPQELMPHFDEICVITGGYEDGPVVELNENAAQIAIRALIDKNPSARFSIVSLNERNVLLAARLNEHFALPSLSEKSLKIYHDKILMKNKLREHHLRVPHHLIIDAKQAHADAAVYFSLLADTLKCPFIIKPSDSAGSYGVVKIANSQDFLSWLHDANRPAHFIYEAEEFIQGTLYHCDTAVYQGKTIFAECCEYSYPNMEFMNNKILSSMVLPPEDPLRQRLLAFTDQVLIALGKLDTVNHMELFVTPQQEIIFLEVAARPSGASSPAMYAHNLGVSLANLYFLTMAHIPYEFNYALKGYSFWAYFPKTDGLLLQRVEPPLQSTYEITWFVKEGDVLHKSMSIAEPAARLFAIAPNQRILQEDFRRLCAYQPLRVQPT